MPTEYLWKTNECWQLDGVAKTTTLQIQKAMFRFNDLFELIFVACVLALVMNRMGKR